MEMVGVDSIKHAGLPHAKAKKRKATKNGTTKIGAKLLRRSLGLLLLLEQEETLKQVDHATRGGCRWITGAWLLAGRQAGA